MNFNCGIYAIIGPSGKRYIGQTINFEKRWRQHLNALRAGMHVCTPLQDAYKKHGENSLQFAKIAFVPRDQLTSREQEQIDSYPAEDTYNVAKCADAPMRDRKHKPESIAKMSMSRTGKPKSEETRKKLSEALRGRKLPEELVKKRIASGVYRQPTGELHHNFGRKHPPERIKDLSQAWSGSKNPRVKSSVICIETGTLFETQAAAVAWLRENGYPKAVQQGISGVCRGLNKRAYGYRWAYP